MGVKPDELTDIEMISRYIVPVSLLFVTGLDVLNLRLDIFYNGLYISAKVFSI